MMPGEFSAFDEFEGDRVPGSRLTQVQPLDPTEYDQLSGVPIFAHSHSRGGNVDNYEDRPLHTNARPVHNPVFSDRRQPNSQQQESLFDSQQPVYPANFQTRKAVVEVDNGGDLESIDLGDRVHSNGGQQHRDLRRATSTVSRKSIVSKRDRLNDSVCWSVFCEMNGSMDAFSAWINNQPVSLWWVLASFLDAVFRGIGQVVFCNNPVTGVFILAALYVESVSLGLLATIGVLSATFVAWALGMDPGSVGAGLAGFNGLLVGCALAVFILPAGQFLTANVVMWTMGGSIGTILVQVGLNDMLVPALDFPCLTLPFNVITLTILGALKGFSGDGSIPEAAPLPPDIDLTATVYFTGIFRGFGQVFLCANIISAALIFVGMLFFSRVTTFAAFGGALIGVSVAAILEVRNTDINNGLLSYNSLLTAQAIFGMFWYPTTKMFFFCVIGCAECVVVQGALANYLRLVPLPLCTLPFCIVTLQLATMKTFLQPHRIPLSQVSTPEKAWTSLHRNDDGMGDGIGESIGAGQ
mmetsp:Transcript_17987/g.29181  ORF Transcript_17987/g.29181 Transcript_17987/m.29181 type:complete len:525 (-) Transcript_17987:164-1738(-)